VAAECLSRTLLEELSALYQTLQLDFRVNLLSEGKRAGKEGVKRGRKELMGKGK